MSSNFDTLKNTPVEDLISPAEVVNPSESVSKIIGAMRDRGFMEAFSEEKGRTAVVRIRDLLDVKDITKTKVSTVMTYVPRLKLRSPVSEAASLMFEYRIRSLPVYDNSHLKGEITAHSIAQNLLTYELRGRISNLMTPSPICVTNNDTVAKAKSLMVRRNVDQIPILKRNKLGGVITSSVIVFNTLPQIDRGRKGGWRGGKHQGSRLDVPVEDFAEPDVTSNDVKETPREVFETMERNRTNYSVIVNYDEVQGIVTYRDFMRPLVEPERKSGEDAVPMYIVGLPEDPFEAEAAKSKFTRVAQLFNKAVPKVEEIRAVIKKGKTKAARKRYEVRVFVKSPLRQYNFEAFGFELPDVFDQVDSWAKGVIGRSDTSFRRRARADPGELR